MGRQYGPLPPLKGSEVWARNLCRVVWPILRDLVTVTLVTTPRTKHQVSTPVFEVRASAAGPGVLLPSRGQEEGYLEAQGTENLARTVPIAHLQAP